ncbi:MAG: plastocyanin/azurin family copper-binding protein [Candidatus Nitrosotenuis sp.]
MAEGASSNTKCDAKCYTSNKAKITVGGTVTWKNVDSAAHTVTAPDGSFDSGLVMAEKTFSHKFGTAGTFSYACTVHPWMKGVVTVR